MTGIVHGAYKQLGGAVAAGQLVITVNTEGQVVRDPVGNVVFQGPQAVKLNKDGLVTLTLPASDDSTLEPSGFTYAIVEQLSHVARTSYRIVEFQVTNGGTIELADLAATDEAALDPSYGANLNAVLAELDGRLSEGDLAASFDEVVNDGLGPVFLPSAQPCVVTLTNDVSSSRLSNVRPPASGFLTSYAPNDFTRFTYLGSVPAYDSSAAYPDSASVFFDYITGSATDPLFTVAPFKAESVLTGRYVEYWFKQIAGATYQVWVDGRPLTLLPQSLGGTAGGTASLVLDFLGVVGKRVQIRANGTRFYGANCDITSRLVATSVIGPRIAMPEDSYFGGAVVGALSTPGGLLGDLLGIDDAWNLSIGGSGYLNPGQKTKARDRIAQTTGIAPDVVLVTLGHNDEAVATYPRAALTAEVNTYISALRTALPNAQIIVTGPLYQGSARSAYVPVEAAIVAGLVGIARVDFISTIDAPPFTGTGNTGSVQHNGNSDLYISGVDGVHPTQDGCFFLAGWLARKIRPLLLASRSKVTLPPTLYAGAPFSDNFNRANAATLGPNWTPLNGNTWSIDTNKARFSGTGTSAFDANYGYVVHDAETPDIDLSATVAGSSAADQGLSFRITSAGNGFFVAFNSAGTLVLYRQDAGVSTSLGTYATGAVTGDTVRVVAKGSSLTVYLNGTSRITATDTHYATATQHGLWAYAPAAVATKAWDNVVMTLAA